MSANRKWRFVRVGGFDQVRLDRGEDLAAIGELDQKLWVALACPIDGLYFDARTLKHMDTDTDKRIRAPELIAAVKWAVSVLKTPDALLASAPELPLDAINDGTDEGKKLLASAREILKNLGKADAKSISPADTSDTLKIFAATALNGDGIVPADSATEADDKAVIEEIIKCVGSLPDRSTKPGVDQAKVDEFFAAASEWLAWRALADDSSEILPLGDGTGAAWAAVQAVKAKVDDYFARCRVVAFDERSAGAMNRQEGEFAALGATVLTADTAAIEAFPLARIAAGTDLPLGSSVNPAWAAKVGALVSAAITPLLGEREVLSPADWTALQAKLAPYGAWQAAKKGVAVDALGRERLQALVDGPSKDRITALIASDKALETEANAISSVDKLALYHRDLYKLAVNFVAFHHFYDPKALAIFQAGTLFLDQRACTLCLRVDNVAKHSAMANLSCAYVAYADCTRAGSNEKFTIAVAFTGGDSDYLAVGRNGIFYDRDGKDWDATITKVVENPISVRQAILSPYKKFAKFIEDQVAKFAGTREKAVETAANNQATEAGKAATATAAAERKDAFDVAKFAGIFAAIGLAIGAIGGAIGAMLGAFSRLAWWQMPLAILGVLILISGPSMLIAALKLRKRNIGPLLDACGWAVNARAKINIPFGGSLTAVARIPAGSDRDMRDPYAENHTRRNVIMALIVLVVILAAGWQLGLVERLKPGVFPRPQWLMEQQDRELEQQRRWIMLEKEKKAAAAAAAEEAAAADGIATPATGAAPATVDTPVPTP